MPFFQSILPTLLPQPSVVIEIGSARRSTYPAGASKSSGSICGIFKDCAFLAWTEQIQEENPHRFVVRRLDFPANRPETLEAIEALRPDAFAYFYLGDNRFFMFALDYEGTVRVEREHRLELHTSGGRRKLTAPHLTGEFQALAREMLTAKGCAGKSEMD